jgi:hypothetical protein
LVEVEDDGAAADEVVVGANGVVEEQREAGQTVKE